MRNILTQGLSSNSQRTLITAGLGTLTAFVELQFCLVHLGLIPAPALSLGLLAVPSTELGFVLSPAIALALLSVPTADLSLIPAPDLELLIRRCCNEC